MLRPLRMASAANTRLTAMLSATSGAPVPASASLSGLLPTSSSPPTTAAIITASTERRPSSAQ